MRAFPAPPRSLGLRLPHAEMQGDRFLEGLGRDLEQSAHPELNCEQEFPMHENGKKMANRVRGVRNFLSGKTQRISRDLVEARSERSRLTPKNEKIKKFL